MSKKFRTSLSWILCIAIIISVLNLPALTTIVKADALKEVQNIHWGDPAKGEIATSVYCDPVQGADRYVVEFVYGSSGGTTEGTTNCIDMKKRVLSAGEGGVVKIKKVDAYIGQIHLATANVEIGKQFEFDKIPTPVVSLNKHDTSDSDYWDITWNFHKKPTYYFFKAVEDFEVDASGNIEFSKMISSLGQNYNSESECKVDFSSFSNEIIPGKVYGFVVKAYFGPDDEFASDEGYFEYVAEKEAIKNITWTEEKGSSTPKVKLYWSRMANVDTYIIYDYKKDVLTSSSKNEIDMTNYIDFEDMSKNQFYIRAYRGSTEYSVLSAAPAYDYGINKDFSDTTVTYNTGDDAEELTFAAHDSCHGGITEYQVHSIIGGTDRIINSKAYKTTTVNINNVDEKIITIKPDTSTGRTTEYYVTYYCPRHSGISTESEHITVIVHDNFSITSNSGDTQIYQGSNASTSLDINGTGVSCEWTVDGIPATGKQNGKTFYLDTLSTLDIGEHHIIATVTDITGQTLTQSFTITVLQSNANHVPMKISKSRVNGYLSSNNPVINLVDVDEMAFTFEWQTEGYAADKIPVIGTISYEWSFYPIKEDGYPDIDNCLLTVKDKDKISAEDLASLPAGEYSVLSSVYNTIIVDGKESYYPGVVAFKLNTTPHSHTFSAGYAQLNDTYHNVYCECGSNNQEKHNWDSALTVDASYKNEGKKVCEDCGYIYKTPQITCSSHNYALISGSDGHYERCMLCGYETTHVAHKKSTLESDIIEAEKAATCTTSGVSAIVKCVDCAYLFPAETIPAKGHSYTKTASITKATIDADGKIVKACDCGKTTTTTIYYPKTITLSATSYTYDGKAHKPTVTVKDSNGKTIAATNNYTVSYINSAGTTVTSPINAGTYKVRVAFKGNYSGNKDLSYTINKKTGSTASLSYTSKAYTGSALKPTVTVKNASGTVLKSGTDYTVAYLNAAGKSVTPTAVGTYTVKVTMKGNYGGTISKTYKIVPKTTTIGTPVIASDGITVKWTKNTSCTGYYIYRSVNGATYTKVKTITSSATVSWKDTTAKTNGNKYQYKIVAYKTVSGKTYTSAYSSVKTIYFVSRPTISSLTNSAAGKMLIKWARNTKASGYQIQYSTSSSFTSPKSVTATGTTTTLSKTIGSLTKGKTYYVRIRSYKTVGTTKYYSAWSAKKTVKITK